MEKYLLIFLVMCLFVGYSNAQNKNETVEISTSNFKDQNILLSDIADGVKYIPLSSKVLISEIGSVKFTDSLLIVVGRKDTGILEFNRDGSFNRKIGSRGKGPGEYIYGIHVDVDNENKNIFVLDLDKVLVYNFRGNLVNTIKDTDFQHFSQIYFINNKLYFFCKIYNSTKYNSPYFWMITDNNGKELFSKKNSLTGFSATNVITGFSGNLAYNHNNKLYYWNHYSDTIFMIEGNTYKAAYLFKKDPNRLTPENSANPDKIENSKHYILENIQESKHFLFIRYRQYGKGHICVYDKATKVFKKMTFERDEQEGFKNDIDSGLTYYPNEITNYDNGEYLISWVNAFELKAHVASEAFKNSTPKYPEKKRELEKLANSLSNNDNPVLMLVKLKE